MFRWLERATLGALLAAGGCVGTASTAPPGVVLVCLDTLRADRLGVLGHTGGLTPNLDRFASEGVVYTQAYAQANETVLSHASLFTGRDPSAWGAFDAAYALPEDARTLAGMLHGAGWQTSAVVAGGHMSRAFGFDAGFDAYDDQLDWGSLADTGPRALAWLDARDRSKPFFMFVHAYDTHDRYLKPTPFGYSHADPRLPGFGRDLGRTAGAASQVADYAWLGATDALERLAVERSRFERGKGARQIPGAVPLTPADLDHIAGLYDGSVAWADASFGLFMADLDARGLLEQAWVVVLADHGHELGEHGSFHHRFALNDATLRVPLMVRPPGGLVQGQRIDALTELVDLMPSLLAVAGVSAPEGIRGRSLYDGSWSAPGRSVVHAEGRLRLLSVRNQTARLTAEGWPADEPGTVGEWSTAPVDSVALQLEGDLQQEDALRSALVDWRQGLTWARP